MIPSIDTDFGVTAILFGSLSAPLTCAGTFIIFPLSVTQEVCNNAVEEGTEREVQMCTFTSVHKAYTT